MVLGSVLALGLIGLVVWLALRVEDKAVDAALKEFDQGIAEAMAKARRETQREIDEEAKTLDSTEPSARFDWLFEEHTD